MIVAGRYRLVARLGEGGAGTVWRAHDELLHRDVAVKSLKTAHADLAIAEARAAARVNHPAIVVIHDVIVENGAPWIVMDLVAARSLDRVIKEGGPLPDERVAAIGLRVLEALDAAHAHGLLHRDVKPANVLLDADGQALLSDFGIAAQLDGQMNSAGSPGYMAPERLRDEPAGPASDLWSLGATLYAAAEGKPPFQRALPAAVVAAVLMAEPPAPAHAGPRLAGLLSAMLAKDQKRRPSSAEIRTALQAVVAGRDHSVRLGRRPWWPVAAGVAAVAVAAGVFLMTRDSPDTGRFAAAPDPCSLLTLTQVQTALGGQVTAERAGTECTWNHRRRGTVWRYVVVRLTAYPPGNGRGATETARLAFAGLRARADSDAGVTFTKASASPSDRTGLGDEAFAQGSYDSFAKKATSMVWFRIGNLVAEIDCAKLDSRETRRGADQAATLVAARLAGTGT
ncbi:serine/threonine protein kinase [Streptosporangiaceae bacterium NEAU-GS5]|nr:serine/threonine protein kinase [Streptosporangiaceae bacterium NEAU-GS5]